MCCLLNLTARTKFLSAYLPPWLLTKMQEKSVFCRSAFLSWCQDSFASTTDGPSIYLAFAAHQIFIALTGAKHQYNNRLVLLTAKIKFLRSSRTQLKSDTTSYSPLAHLHLRSSACMAIFLALSREQLQALCNQGSFNWELLRRQDEQIHGSQIQMHGSQIHGSLSTTAIFYLLLGEE